MAEHSAIEWTDATWNPITGCSLVSPGCAHCYAMTLAGTRLRHHPSRAGLTQDTKAGPVWNGQVRLNEDWLDQPLRWRRPRMIFVCAHGDLFHESVPDAWIDRVFAVMALAPQHTFQALTKRSARMQAYCSDMVAADRVWAVARAQAIGDPFLRPFFWQGRCNRWPGPSPWPLRNVWLGVSAEDQQRADERRDDLAGLAASGWVTFASYEPALGPVDWRGWEFLSWLISGGESGPQARPNHPDWHRAARDFCAPHGIPYFFKQWGNWAPSSLGAEIARASSEERILRDGQWTGHAISPACASAPDTMNRVGKKAAGRLLDGVEHNGMPEECA